MKLKESVSDVSLVLKHISDPKIQDGRQIRIKKNIFVTETEFGRLAWGMNATANINMPIDKCIAQKRG